MMDVSLEVAYREACLALGESLVRERLLTAEIERLQSRAPTEGLASETAS